MFWLNYLTVAVSISGVGDCKYLYSGFPSQNVMYHDAELVLNHTLKEHSYFFEIR